MLQMEEKRKTTEQVRESSEGGQAEGWHHRRCHEMEADDPLLQFLKGTTEGRRYSSCINHYLQIELTDTAC